MKVILLKEVPKLGHKFDVKDVSDGHAQNFLIPRGLVVPATPAAEKKIKAPLMQGLYNDAMALFKAKESALKSLDLTEALKSGAEELNFDIKDFKYFNKYNHKIKEFDLDLVCVEDENYGKDRGKAKAAKAGKKA